MSVTEIFVFFVVLWWLVLFMALPFGVRVPEEPEKGHAASAPVKPNILKKMLITSLISIVITALFYLAMDAGVFDGVVR